MDNQNLPNVPVPGPTPEPSAPVPTAPENFAPGGAPPVQPFAADAAYTVQEAGNPQGQAPYYAAQPVPGADGAPAPTGNAPPASGGFAPPPSAYPPGAQGVYPGYPAPVGPPPKKKRKGLIIGLAAGLAAVLLLGTVATVAVRMLLPATTVMSAVSKTFNALQTEQENNLSALGISQAFEMLETSPAEQEIYLELPESGLLPGRMGARATVQSDLPGRKLLADIDVEQSGLSLFTGTFAANDDLLSFSAPVFFRGSYGLHTETLGEDWNRSALRDMLGLDIPDDLSFNLFDMADTSSVLTDESTAKISEIVKTASGDVTVKSGAKGPATVNGEILNCRLYTVTLPKSSAQEALRGIVDVVLNDENYRKSMEESTELASMAGGYTSVDEMIDEMTDVYGELADSLQSDITANVWVAGGYMRRAELSLAMNLQNEDYNVAVAAEFGTKEQMGGALTVGVSINDQTLQMVRTNTVLEKAGPYSSGTQMYLQDGEGAPKETVLDMKLEYDPGAERDNFRLRLVAGVDSDFALDVRGTVSIDSSKKSIDADFDKIEIDTYYSTTSLKGSYRLVPLDGGGLAMPEPKLLTDMSESGLEDLMSEIEESVYSLTW